MLTLREPGLPYVAILAFVLLASSSRLYGGLGGEKKQSAVLRLKKREGVAWWGRGWGGNDIWKKKPGGAVAGTTECPFDYIIELYGRGHFTKIVNTLDPKLELRDGVLYKLILEVMDTIHAGAILVDDIADNSALRKGKPAAHHIYGASETINRAYLRINEVILKCLRSRPTMIPFILECLTEIHKGQDDSLVWRRDGFPTFPNKCQALDTYRECASLKTGALSRLVGQLTSGSHDKDELMSRFGWYCHLQNDCKNVYAADIINAKGALAEDLKNGEYSFPIISALYSSRAASVPVETALDALRQQDELKTEVREEYLKAALDALQVDEVRSECLAELESVRADVSTFATLWGRHEKMNLGNDGRA